MTRIQPRDVQQADGEDDGKKTGGRGVSRAQHLCNTNILQQQRK